MDSGKSDLDRYIIIWAKAVDTQMHFNEMSVKSRQLGLTFVAAALGVGVVLLSRGNDFSMSINLSSHKFQLHVSVVLLVAAWLALISVRQLDLHVYHKMLRGAVAFGEDFEKNYMKEIFDLECGMTQAISHFSRFNEASVVEKNNGKYNYIKGGAITAEDKIKEFYKNTSIFLWVSAIALFAITNHEVIHKIIQ